MFQRFKTNLFILLINLIQLFGESELFSNVRYSSFADERPGIQSEFMNEATLSLDDVNIKGKLKVLSSSTCSKNLNYKSRFEPKVVDIPDPPEPEDQVIFLPRGLINELPEIANEATFHVDNLFSVVEPRLIEKGYAVPKYSTASMASTFSQAKPESKDLSRKAMVNIHVTKHLTSRLNLTDTQIAYGLPKLNLEISYNKAPIHSCGSGNCNKIASSNIATTNPRLLPSTVTYFQTPSNVPNDNNQKEMFVPQSSGYRKKRQTCDSSMKYRSYNGFCNNLSKPNWGNALIPFLRLLAPDYDDGVQSPRLLSKINDNIFLPSARKISLIIHNDVSNANEHDITHMVMQWGQFIDHDITHTPTTTVNTSNNNQKTLDCCRFLRKRKPPHESCIMPILMSDDDPMADKRNIKCMQFVRSSPASDGLGVRQQLNQITAFIDGSQVYGSSESEANSLRSFINGRLQSTTSRGQKDLLPRSSENICPGEKGSIRCFRAGDVRVNEQTLLATLQTLWMREHNRLADELHQINQHWDDEKLFQETRRIIWAQIQHITYKEWIPTILGNRNVDRFGLAIWPKGFLYIGYSDQINPGIQNEFAAAAFRFGHSTVQQMFELRNSSHSINGEVKITDTFFKPFHLYKRGFADKYILGMINQWLMKSDPFLIEDLTFHLFQSSEEQFGLDLAALNIQRGRDHGIPGYNKYRNFCGLKIAHTFNDLKEDMPSVIVDKLEEVYRTETGEVTVDDIDLFTGGLAENPVKGGIIGPVFSCIIGRQFNKLRRGDRFWFENNISSGAFTLEQVDSIRDSSLSKIICDNTDVVQTVQPNVFRVASRKNQRVSCDILPGIDLELWREFESK